MLFKLPLILRALSKTARLPSLPAAALALATLSNVVSGPSMAGDLEGYADADNGHFIRIALHKSVVIKLPADAKDVIVGEPDIVDAVVRTKNTAYLFARKVGQTNIFFFGPDGRQIMNIDLEVALDGKALHKLIQRTIPGSRITVDTVNENVILNGTAANASEAKMAEDLAAKFINASGATTNVVNAMTIAGEDQVMLKVRVVEVKRDVVKEFGINLKAAFDFGKIAGSFVTANPVTGLATGVLGFNGDKFDITATIKAMEKDGLLRILAEPNLTAVSGQTAKFHAGGEFATGSSCSGTVVTGGSATTCKTDFKPFGVSLEFKPVVLTEGRISLTIATEVSDINFANKVGNIPGVDTRNAETTIEMPSGGSMMLAGLIKDVTGQQIDGTPGLKNLPVLGALFRSRSYTANETELVVIVTSYIVNPVHETDLVTPADGLNMPTDRQTILFGRLNKVYGTPGKHPDGVYHGNVGFIVE